MKFYTFRVIIEPDENNTYHGYVPVLKGCHTWGDSIEETRENLKEAIKCHAEGLLLDNQPVPQETDVLESIQVFSERHHAGNFARY